MSKYSMSNANYYQPLAEEEIEFLYHLPLVVVDHIASFYDPSVYTCVDPEYHFVRRDYDVIDRWIYNGGWTHDGTYSHTDSSLLYFDHALTYDSIMHLCESCPVVGSCAEYEGIYFWSAVTPQTNMMPYDTQSGRSRANKRAKPKPWRKRNKNPIFCCPISEYEVALRQHCEASADYKSAVNIPVGIVDLAVKDGITRAEIKTSIRQFFDLHSGVEDTPAQFLQGVLGEASRSSNGDYLLSMLEDVVATVVVLESATTVSQCVAVMVLFLKARFGNDTSLLSSCRNFIANILSEELPCDEQAGWQDTARSFKAHLQHPAFKHAGILVSLLVTAGLVAPDCFQLSAVEAFNVKFHKLDFSHGIVDTLDTVLLAVTFFLETGYKCFQTSSLVPFYDSCDPVWEFYTDSSFLEANIGVVVTGNYMLAHKQPPSAFGALLVKTITNGTTLHKTCASSYDKAALMRQLHKLHAVQQRYDSFERSAGLRTAPFCIKFVGKSGVGKTTINQLTVKALLLANGFDATDENIVNIQPADKFISNYKTSATAAIVDDMCNATAAKSETNPAQLLIMLVGNTFVYAPMAEADKKGKISLEPKLVTITTNKADLDAHIYSNEPFSILRRCHLHVTVEVRPEFATLGKLDARKVALAYPDENNAVQDIWLLTVQEALPEDNKSSMNEAYKFVTVQDKNTKKYLSKCSIFEFLNFTYEMSAAYYAHQEIMVSRNTCLESKMNICKECHRIAQSCICPVCVSKDEQYGIVDDIVNSVSYQTWVTLASGFVLRTSTKLARSILDNILPGRYETRLLQASVMSSDALEFVGMKKPRIAWYDCLLYAYPSLRTNKCYGLIGSWIERTSYQNNLWRTLLPLSLCNFALFTSAFYCSPRLRIFPICGSIGLQATGMICARDYCKTLLYKRIGYENTSAQVMDLQGSSMPHPALQKLARLGITMVSIGAIVATIKVLRVTYVKYVLASKKEHGCLDPTSKDDIFARDSEKNIWTSYVKPVVKCTGFSPDFMINKFSKNVMSIKVLSTGRFCNALFVSTNQFLMPYHMWFAKDQFTERLDTITLEVIRTNATSTGSTRKTTLVWSNCVRLKQGDMVLCYDAGGGPYSDLTEHFSDDLPTSGLYYSVARSRAGVLVKGSGRYSGLAHKYTTMSGENLEYYGVRTYHSADWLPGDCCTVLISNTVNPVMVGLHLLGTNDRTKGTSDEGFAMSVIKQDLIDARKLLFIRSQPPLHGGGDIPMEVCGKSIQYRPTLDRYSPVHWLEDYNMTIYGSSGVPSTCKTDIRSSILVPSLMPFFGPQRWAGPNFAPDGKKWRPWFDTMDYLANPRVSIDTGLLCAAMLDYERPLLEKIYLHVQHLRPLSRVEILSGIDGIRFIDAMNLNTSMGFPLDGVKRNHLDDLPSTEEHSRPLDWKNPIFWTELENMEQTYLEGKMCHPIFKACLKDEPTVIGKNKVRVFEAAPVVLQMAIRKYFLPVARLISLHPLESECAVGINCFSLEWQQMHKHITTFGDDRILAGDYEKWDLRLPAQLIACAFDIFLSIAKASGNYSERDLYIMRGIASDVSMPTVSYNGTLVQLHGSNPSGQNLTAYINSICNSLLVRVGFFHCCGVQDFRKSCKIMTYGDDLIGCVSTNVRNFDHVVYANYLRDHCDMGFTMPDKVSLPIPFLNISDVDFLKRKSVYSDELGVHVGALALSSIYKSLYCVKGKKYLEADILSGVITGALHELFFHGKEIYDEHLAILNTVCKKHRLRVLALGMTYTHRVAIWLHQYRGVEMPSALVYQPTEAWLDDGLIEQMGCAVQPVQVSSFAVTREELLHKRQNKFTEYNLIENAQLLNMGIANDLNVGLYALHSGVYTEEANAASSAVMNFALMDDGFSTGVASYQDDTFDMIKGAGDDLNDFLKRPVRVSSESWAPGSPLSYSFDPLRNFLFNDAVASRISNYKWISGTMCIKVVVNGTNFHYGKVLVSVDHWPEFSVQGPGQSLTIIQHSQLPHICVDPTTATAGCLEVPLFHPNSAIELSNLGVANVVNIHVNSMNDLKTVGNTTGSLDIVIYAWMKDYKLMIPTALPNDIQSGSEFSQPIVSGTATAIANMMAPLKTVPIVGRYARASEMICNVTASVATLFGYSRPSIVKEEMAMQNRPVGNLSNYNFKDSCTKLALDSMNEVTIDPYVTGYAGQDDMALKTIVQREAYVTTTSWSPSQANRVGLIRTAVTPTLHPGADINETYDMSPLMHATLPFKYWRGTLKIRFEVVASAFHKGKLRIVYDPNAMANGGAALASWQRDTNTTYSYILDISKEREYVMEVGWAHGSNYLVRDPTLYKHWAISDDVLTSSMVNCNGGVGVSVELPLSSTLGPETPDVYLNVYISAADDYEVAMLDDTVTSTLSLNNLDPQSGIEPTPGVGAAPGTMDMPSMNLNQVSTSKSTEDKLALIHFGEKVVSIRQILKRYSFTEAIPIDIDDETFSEKRFVLYDFPVYSGYNNPSIYTDSLAQGVSYASSSNLLTWYTPAYLMRRGALRNKYVFVSSAREERIIKPIEFYGEIGAICERSNSRREFNFNQPDWMAYDFCGQEICTKSVNGMSVTIPHLNTCLELETPNYNTKRWYFAQNRNKTASVPDGDLKRESTHRVVLAASSGEVPERTFTFLRRFVAGGDDYSLHYYKFAPRARLYIAVEPAA